MDLESNSLHACFDPGNAKVIYAILNLALPLLLKNVLEKNKFKLLITL